MVVIGRSLGPVLSFESRVFWVLCASLYNAVLCCRLGPPLDLGAGTYSIFARVFCASRSQRYTSLSPTFCARVWVMVLLSRGLWLYVGTRVHSVLACISCASLGQCCTWLSPGSCPRLWVRLWVRIVLSRRQGLWLYLGSGVYPLLAWILCASLGQCCPSLSPGSCPRRWVRVALCRSPSSVLYSGFGVNSVLAWILKSTLGRHCT